MRQYSLEFKNALVEKVLNRGGRSFQGICKEAGVSTNTVLYWVQKSSSVPVVPKKRGRKMKWNPEAKLKAIFDTRGLSEIELGTYLRKEGLYSTQVSEWRADVIEHFSEKSPFKKDERDLRITVLEREILRKDKALAEASALLILQKKVDLIWGSRSEEEK